MDTYDLVNSICENGSTLQVLDLSNSTLVSTQLKLIIKKCVELKELNLAGVMIWSEIANVHYDNYFADYLAKNLTTKIEKLSIVFMNFRDENVKTLVSRCTKISSINLAITKITEDSLKSIIDHLGQTLEELHLTTYFNDKFSVLKVMLKELPKLKILNTEYKLNIYDPFSFDDFGKELNSISVNKKEVIVAANISPGNGIWEIKTEGILE